MDLPTRLSCLFGTEEYVSMRRQLVLLRDKMNRYIVERQNIYIICSGSLGEGVAYPTSDDDLMFCYTDHRVVQTYRDATQIGDILMVSSETSPGYCLLLDVRGSYSHNVIQIIDEMPFVSSSLFSHLHLREGQTIHGPCQSGTAGTSEFDFATCYQCFTWPDLANAWLIRNRSYEWPSAEMIQNIVQNCCHVVPVGDPDSPYCQHEWRISFSVAERILMHSFNHSQFLVYNLLRLTLKRIIGKTLPDVLCSYFMKTTLFYTAENTPIQLWQGQNIERCFRSCLSVLYDYVDSVYCPNYFIPEYNMIKRKINSTNRDKMLDMIRTIHTIGIVGVLHVCGESHWLDDRLSIQLMECKLDREFMISDHFLKAIDRIEDFFHTLSEDTNQFSSFYLSMFMNLLLESSPNMMQRNLLNIIWNGGINSYNQKMMTCLTNISRLNKKNYNLYKRLESLMSIGFRTDVTTGKLTAATYMYIVGKTESALHVIRQLLSEYPPYAIDRRVNELKFETYIDVMCGRGYSIDYKVKRAFVPDYSLHSKCMNSFPPPLRILISISGHIAPDPLTYSYFLQSLCYVQQENQSMLKKSTKCLINHKDHMPNDLDIAHVRMCVGIIKYIRGDKQSARRWLGSVYIMSQSFPPPFHKKYSLSALTYLSCLLNKHFRVGFL